MDDTADETPRPPAGPPKVLPRIQYKPPEPEPQPSLDPELDEEAEDETGEIPLGEASSAARPAKRAPSPPGAGGPKRPSPVANPPKSAPRSSAQPSTSRGRAAPIEVKPAKPKAVNPSRGITSDIDKTGKLVEATPEGETHEGRRRVRMMVGAAAGAVLLISGIVVWRSLRSDDIVIEAGSGPPPETASAGPIPRVKTSPAVLKAEAQRLLTDARSLEKAGKMKAAVAKVEKVIASYAETPSAAIALAARERNRQGLPLFVDGAAVVATKSDAKDEPEPEADPPAADVVAAQPPVKLGSPREVMPAATAVAPSIRVEPRRPTGVALPRADVAARGLPQGFRARAEAGVHPSGWPLEIVGERDGATLVLVPGDRFIQGRDDGRPEERPAHAVRLGTFYVDQHEVTARQFAAFRPASGAADDRPCVNVSLNDARAYAQWAGKSLPTEAQWEMAARATDARIHPWGNAAPSWERKRAPKQIDPVMSFPGDMSPYGAFDLAGNAWEWTGDWFDTKYYAMLKGQSVANPTGPVRGVGRLPDVVIKGGSANWDGSWRSGMKPEAKLPYLGFRCVLNVDAAVPAGDAPAASGRAPVAPGRAPVPTATPPGTVPF